MPNPEWWVVIGPDGEAVTRPHGDEGEAVQGAIALLTDAKEWANHLYQGVTDSGDASEEVSDIDKRFWQLLAMRYGYRLRRVVLDPKETT